MTSPAAIPGSAGLEGRVVLVTGGSRGIGRAIVLSFAALGCRVVFCYRTDHAAADRVRDEALRHGWTVAPVRADVTVRAEVDTLVRTVEQDHGRIDVLVNNAGTFPAKPVVDMTDDEWFAVINANLNAVFYTCRAVLPGMIAASGGSIVNLASIAGQRGSAYHAHYAAAKGGVIAFTRSLAREVIRHNVRVNAVSPGRIATDLLLESQTDQEYARWMADTPAKRLGTPEETAAAVIFLASPAAAYIVGETIAVNGGLLMD